MEAVGYVRVSTTRQAEFGLSLAAQKAKIEEWCRFRSLTLASVYVDEGISGKKLRNRPGINKAIADACKRKCPMVAVSLSRFSRSAREAIEIAEMLRKGGGDLVSLSESLDTSSATGKMVFNILASFAQFESDLASERTKAVIAWKKANGGAWGEPFGYRVVKGKMERNDKEWVIVERILHYRSCGLSYSAIAGLLNGLNLKTKQGKEWKSVQVRDVVKREERNGK